MTHTDAASGEGTVTVTPAVTPEAGHVESHPAVDAGVSPQQELPATRDEGNVPPKRLNQIGMKLP